MTTAARKSPRPLQPVYSVTKLAALLGVTRSSCHRLLLRSGVDVDRTMPGKHLVWLSSIRDGCPEVWSRLLGERAARNPGPGEPG